MLKDQTSDLLYKFVGEKIKLRRQQLQWTQQKLADKLDLTRTSIANIESGTQRAPLDTIFKIAHVLGYESFYHVLPDFSLVNTSDTSNVKEIEKTDILQSSDCTKITEILLKINRTGQTRKVSNH